MPQGTHPFSKGYGIKSEQILTDVKSPMGGEHYMGKSVQPRWMQEGGMQGRFPGGRGI